MNASHKEAPVSSSAKSGTSDDTAAVRRFLEDAGVTGPDESPMTLSEMRVYVLGRMAR